jgi:hypothetical protein
LVLRRTQIGDEYAWIGKLRPLQASALDFKSGWIAGETRPERDDAPITAARPPVGTISLKSLVALAEKTHDMNEGDVRLIGWTENEMPGMHIEPRSSQQRHATLVVANLRSGLGRPPVKDLNTRAEIAKPGQNDEDYELPPLESDEP